LREIIAHDGSCNWADSTASEICAICPLSRLATNDRGDFLSCIDAVMISELSTTTQTINQKYKIIAQQLLDDIEFEDAMLGEESHD
jgi:hypothetical protein